VKDIEVAQCKFRWRAFVTAVYVFRYLKIGKFLEFHLLSVGTESLFSYSICKSRCYQNYAPLFFEIHFTWFQRNFESAVKSLG
jgi:hypothetical protein